MLDLSDMTSLEILKVSTAYCDADGNIIDDNAGIITLTGDDTLANLKLFDCGGDLTEFTVIFAMTNLEVLSTDNSDYYQQDLSELSSLSQLRALRLTGDNPTSEQTDLSFLSQCPALEVYYCFEYGFYNFPDTIPNDQELFLSISSEVSDRILEDKTS